MLISNNRLNRIYERENYLDDKGLTKEASKKTRKTMKFGTKFGKYLIKPFLGFMIGILFLILPDLVNDIYYYSGCFIIFAFVLLGFIDLLREHNMLCKRKIPQLEKRGGNQ